MYVVSGARGNTGAAVVAALLARGLPVRVIVRSDAARDQWRARGAEVVYADFTGSASLDRALDGAVAAYILNPPAYASPDLFGAAQAVLDGWRPALERSRLRKLVVLSSIGSHKERGHGIIHATWMFERQLRDLAMPVTFVRPAYFMENWAWVAQMAAAQGVLPCYLSPVDRAIPMVAAADIGRVCADAMLDFSPGTQTLELEGPQAYSPLDVAEAFSEALGKPVQAVALPESQWGQVLKQAGFSERTILEWAELFHGFNSGYIELEGNAVPRLTGSVPLSEAIAAIVHRLSHAASGGYS